MSLHRFAVGQEVVFKSARYRSNAPQGSYHIVALLPDTRYRVRSPGERHERMADEDSIEDVHMRSLLSPEEPTRFPSLDRATASRPHSYERLEYARRQKSDCDGTLRRIRQLVEDNRLL